MCFSLLGGFQKLMPRYGLVFVLILYFFLNPAQSAQDEYLVKAAFIEKMIRFVNWPDKPNQHKSPQVRLLCLIGKNPFNSHLDHMTDGNTARTPGLRIRRIDTPRQIPGCDVLYISRSEARRLEPILKQSNISSVLTISDTEGFAERGVILNMYIENEKLGFEINKPAVTRSGLKVSFKLLRLARIID